MSIEIILTVVAGILLLLHWSSPYIVWGGAIIGVVVGSVASPLAGDWEFFPWSFAVGTFIGVISEWIVRTSRTDKATKS